METKTKLYNEDIIKNVYSDYKLNNFQLLIKNIIDNYESDRLIYIICDEAGGIGKTTLFKILSSKGYNIFYTNGGKTNDLAYNWNYENILFYDIPKSKDEINFDFIECFKNGIINSNKYEGGLKLTLNTKCFIFTNKPYNYFINKFSPDRLRFIIIDNKNRRFLESFYNSNDLIYEDLVFNLNDLYNI